jgi:hypothetical protein
MAMKFARVASCKVINISTSNEKVPKVKQLENSGKIATINFERFWSRSMKSLG